MRLVEAESNDRLAPFRTMSRDEFLGKPRITSLKNASALKPRLLRSLQDLPRVPFLSGLTAVYDADGAAVLDGDKVVASYNFGDTLVVDRAYRRRGIGLELVYQWRTRFPNAAPATHRTKLAQTVQTKVWDRIQNELRLDEAAAPGVSSFWFNSADGQIIPVSDHGDAVIESPDTFGIDYRTQMQMDAAFPEGMDSDPQDEEEFENRQQPDVDATPAELWGGHEGWDRNTAWETLAMNRGWVRVGGASQHTAAYVSSGSGAAVWAAVNYLYKNAGINTIEIEIARPENEVFTTIGGDDLKMFIKGGPKRADAFLAAR